MTEMKTFHCNWCAGWFNAEIYRCGEPCRNTHGGAPCRGHLVTKDQFLRHPQYWAGRDGFEWRMLAHTRWPDEEFSRHLVASKGLLKPPSIHRNLGDFREVNHVLHCHELMPLGVDENIARAKLQQLQFESIALRAAKEAYEELSPVDDLYHWCAGQVAASIDVLQVFADSVSDPEEVSIRELLSRLQPTVFAGSLRNVLEPVVRTYESDRCPDRFIHAVRMSLATRDVVFEPQAVLEKPFQAMIMEASIAHACNKLAEKSKGLEERQRVWETSQRRWREAREMAEDISPEIFD